MPEADYATGYYLPHEIMAKHMAQAVMDIDYGNFKATMPSQDRLRHDAYFQCREAMWGWQGKLKNCQ